MRVSELVDLRWQQIDLDTASIHIRRAKNGTPGNHANADPISAVFRLRYLSRFDAEVGRIADWGPWCLEAGTGSVEWNLG